jgi:hypothetical protein
MYGEVNLYVGNVVLVMFPVRAPLKAGLLVTLPVEES